MSSVIQEDYAGLHIQIQGDRIQGLFHLPRNDERAIALQTISAAIGLQSSMECTLKACLPEAEAATPGNWRRYRREARFAVRRAEASRCDLPGASRGMCRGTGGGVWRRTNWHFSPRAPSSSKRDTPVFSGTEGRTTVCSNCSYLCSSEAC